MPKLLSVPDAALPELAFAVHPGPGLDTGRVVIIERGVYGYRPVPNYDVSPKERRRFIAHNLNTALQVTDEQAYTMLSRSILKWGRKGRSR